MTPSVFAVDPGPERSAYVLFDGKRVLDFDIHPNKELRSIAHTFRNTPLVIEGVACYGMPVGKEVFDTCIWIGRFIEAHNGDHKIIYRQDVKLHLCHSARAKDPMVRQALLDRFGPGKERAVGRKKSPGPLYGVSSHCWSALAIAVTWYDQHP